MRFHIIEWRDPESKKVLLSLKHPDGNESEASVDCLFAKMTPAELTSLLGALTECLAILEGRKLSARQAEAAV